jgi:hypothetical protein
MSIDGESTTGAVMGLTEGEVSSCSAASQHDTVVLPNHRGRGVGATSTVNVRRLGYREIRRRSLVQANVSDLGRQLRP